MTNAGKEKEMVKNLLIAYKDMQCEGIAKKAFNSGAKGEDAAPAATAAAPAATANDAETLSELDAILNEVEGISNAMEKASPSLATRKRLIFKKKT